MQINRFRNDRYFLVKIAATLFFLLAVATWGYAGESAEENVVASGDGFVMTRKTVDAYNAYFISQKLRWSPNEVTKTALKYELLSREYRKTQEGKAGIEDRVGDADKVELKIMDGKKYIQGILDNWMVSSAAIEAYYRSNPEKFSTGKTPDGKIITNPLDDRQRNEIRFKIIEGKKEVIVKEFVDSLITNYHIVMNNGG